MLLDASMTGISSEWQLTIGYMFSMLLFVCCSKLLSAFLSRKKGKSVDRLFFIAPCLSWQTYCRASRLTSAHVVVIALKSVLLLTATTWGYLDYVPVLARQPEWLRPYGALPLFWLLVEAILELARLFWFFSGSLLPPLSREPWRAASLAEFWGRRWNLLFGDWLRQAVFDGFSDKPHVALFASFFLSGLVHEWLISLPFQLVYGESVWGMMSLYFLLQYLGLVIERCWISPRSGYRRIFLWLVVVGPVPLILNRATLAVFMLVPLH